MYSLLSLIGECKSGFRLSIAFLFSMTLRKYLSRVGAKGLDLQQKSLAKLIDMINSTKEILAFGKYKVFTKQFKN